MFNNTIFRITFAISLSFHLAVISAGSFFHKAVLLDKKPDIEITYLTPETPQDKLQEKVIENLPQIYDLKDKKLQQTSEKSDEQYLEAKELAKLEEYIQYYELIREKIKKRVTENYTRFHEEGIAEVVFRLNKNGALENLTLNESKSTTSQLLKKTALKSVSAAAPFPAFPPSLDRGDLTFTIALIFKNK